MRRLLLIPGLVVVASAALYTGACGGSDDSTGDESVEEDFKDVIFDGATDEALVALLGATPKTEASQAAVLVTPEDGATLPSGAAPAFTWRIRGAAQRGVPSLSPWSAPGARGGPSLDPLRELLGPMRVASAHGTPVNGRAYFLVLSSADGETLVRVFTTKLAYTLDDGAWGKVRAAKGPINATVLNAVFESNRVAPSGGPFEGAPVTFTVAP